jgi:hypothetical protein
MRQTARENGPCALIALVCSAALAWLGLSSFAWSDYESEARPAFEALAHGHLTQFLRLSPAYGGSLIERGPFALIPNLWGGGQLAVYRAVALPCLLAVALLGICLAARMRAEGRPAFARALALMICVANPLTLRALELGHPEDLLGAALCIGAVLLAGSDRPLSAGVMLGLAVANKEWALLAAGPVLLALAPGRRRLTCAAASFAIAALVLAPLVLVGSGGFAASARASASTSAAIFHPWQLWWFFGHHVQHASGVAAASSLGYRVGPGWASTISHPLILLVGFVLSAALWLREHRGPARRTTLRASLLALALLLLLRCLLDTWDTSYYALPFLLALLAWEVRGEHARPPVLAAAATVIASLGFLWLPQHASADFQAVFFLLWSLPLAIGLGMRLFAPLTATRIGQLGRVSHSGRVRRAATA